MRILVLVLMTALTFSSAVQAASCERVFQLSYLEAKLFLEKKFQHLSKEERAQVLKFLDEAVLADPQFHRDPKRYLEKWDAFHGGVPVMRMPSDPALSFLVTLRGQEELEMFLMRAKDEGILANADASKFLRTSWERSNRDALESNAIFHFSKTLKGRDAKKATDFLKTRILPDPVFQERPEFFMEMWANARKGQPLDTYPEIAFQYISQLKFMGLLDRFAYMAVLANFPSAPGTAPFHSNWK